ncbi:hypothetical protein SARC_09426 [Sphaeroforma arctica JP610]|uniref:TRAF-type domain-containing protein n=1 Tax=Sphaeroforma arctica JP610 TaxID=667725 RepID=A0A0L0FN17_9EUKA|nr:hypothetical protein SARC_09426 [Sphaeroforma arctica JP610]KNC78129.1 hypothetical protein SARC_09426 [Sphaeroforma arctica JP610]|eukprot:XP_014152031.1 hypothetical protein SARC_09426 [Sphaeroforma arctica JP610]
MPITRLVSHERHCKNNTYSCPTCDVKLPLDSREWHEVFMHTRTTCVCSAELTHHALLNAHVRMECSKRMIQCSNLGCLLLTPAYRHTEHLRECGSVTIACPICIENVCRSAAVFHFEAMHGIQAEQLRSGVPLEDQVAALIAAGKVYDF